VDPPSLPAYRYPVSTVSPAVTSRRGLLGSFAGDRVRPRVRFWVPWRLQERSPITWFNELFDLTPIAGLAEEIFLKFSEDVEDKWK
jgi:hypothetical protein